MPFVSRDCRSKEKMYVKRVGGDLALIFTDENDKVTFEIWLEMKTPTKNHYEAIESLFQQISKHLQTHETDRGHF